MVAVMVPWAEGTFGKVSGHRVACTCARCEASEFPAKSGVPLRSCNLIRNVTLLRCNLIRGATVHHRSIDKIGTHLKLVLLHFVLFFLSMSLFDVTTSKSVLFFPLFIDFDSLSFLSLLCTVLNP